jgi:hypothetical protein
MVQKKKNSILPGIFLIFIGLWLFSRQSSYLSFHWDKVYPIFLVVLGLLLISEVFWRSQTGNIFWGVIALILGIFFILRNFDVIPYFYADEYWPIFLAAIGLGLLLLFLLNPKDWGILVPACLFLFFGVGFFIHMINGSYWGWTDFLMHYWPVIFICIGLTLIFHNIIYPTDKKK